MPSNDAMRVKTEQLPVGSRLSHPINDGEHRLLLAAGVMLTAKIKERLLTRGITEVLLHPDDAAALLGLAKPAAAKTDAAPVKKSLPRPVASSKPSLKETVAQIKLQASALAASVSLQVTSAGSPLSQRQIARGTRPYNIKQRERVSKQFHEATQLLSRIAHQAIERKLSDESALNAVAENFVIELTEDTDNVLATSTQAAPNPAITQRGVRLALLGMAMSIELDWDEANVCEVGLCGLVHDFGKFLLDERFREPGEQFSTADRITLANHPLLTLDLLTPMRNVSLAVRLAATQVHENPDGSGYPRGLKREEIHPYASILHVADAYITLTAETKDRRAYLSYDAIVYLLNQVKLKRVDEQAMRALLQVVSLFPIGSHVRLSDGSEAQVLRRNGNHYSTPIVQRVGADRQPRYDSAHASIVDLAAAKMRVMAPLVPPEREEERLDESLMSKVLWESPLD